MAALAMPAIALAAAGSSARTTTARPHLSEHRILEVALVAAAHAGDPEPVLIQHSAGTRHQANLIDSGDLVSGKQWSYLIAERGRFVLNNVPTPPGAPTPRGTVLTVIVNAASGQVTDFGVSHRYPRLARLGPVITDLRRSKTSRSTTVPAAMAEDLDRAYSILHAAGLRISYPSAFAAGSGICLPLIQSQTPSAGSSAAPETTVIVKGPPPPCGAGSPAVPVGPLPHATVPDFIGKRLSTAITWTSTNELTWYVSSLPPLHSGSAPSLYDNYIITAQTPAAGSTLSLGVESGGGQAGSFAPTPLTLTARTS